MSDWITVKDVAVILNIGVSSVRKDAKKYGGVRDFGHWRFYRPFIENLQKAAIQKAKAQMETVRVA